MSKEDKHIDKLFQEKLSDRPFDGPSADFLADLNQRLDEKATVSRGWIWILFLNLVIIGLFVVSATVDFSSSKTTEVAQQIDNKEQSASKEESFKNQNDQKKNSVVEGNHTKVNNTAEKENNLENENHTSSQNSLSLEESSKSSSEGNESSIPNNVESKNEVPKIAESNNEENSNKDNSSESNNTPSTEEFSNKDNSDEKHDIEKIEGKKEKASNKTTEKEPSSEKSTTNIEGATMTSTPPLSTYVSYSEIYAPQFFKVDRKIKSNDFPKFPNPWNELAKEKNNKSPNIENDTEKRMFEIQLQGGATQWSFKTLGTSDSYVDQIDQSGTPKWTPHFGLGFNVNFSNISIGTGVDYAKFKTENLFKFPEISTYDSTYISGYSEDITYDSLGNPSDTTYSPHYDSTTVNDTTYNSIQITNQYEWIQIPLHIGYRFNLNKWAIIPRAGMNIGLGIRQTSGQYPNEAYDDLQAIDPVKWQLNLHTSLEIRRKFGRWHVFGKFNYQRNLTPTIDNALFERKYNGIGFNFGVGYNFF